MTSWDSFVRPVMRDWTALDMGERVKIRRAAGQLHEFQVFAVAQKLPPDWAWDIGNELNFVYACFRKTHSRPYDSMCQAFAGELRLGQGFLLDVAAVEEVVRLAGSEDGIHAHLVALDRKMEQGLKGITEELAKVGARVNEAVMGRDEDKYLEFASLLKKTSLPLPFGSARECETFLADSANFGLAQTTFKNDNRVLAFRRKKQAREVKYGGVVTEVRDEILQNEQTDECKFPVYIVAEFMFKPRILVGSGMEFQGELGEHSTAFFLDRSRYLMGPEWERDDAYIMERLRKHINYKNNVGKKRKRP